MLFTSISFGSTRFKSMERTNTTATTFSENTDWTIAGAVFQIRISLALVNPIPMDRDSAVMVMFLWVYPHLEIICIPEVRMVPNIMIVHPPRTDSGRDEKKFPTGGRRPARIMQSAPVIIVKRFTTFVMATNPTFWEKDVTGGQPKIAEIVEEYPSQASEPEISLLSISRFSPPAASAEVSPMVSAADTRNIIHAEMIAPA